MKNILRFAMIVDLKKKLWSCYPNDDFIQEFHNGKNFRRIKF